MAHNFKRHAKESDKELKMIRQKDSAKDIKNIISKTLKFRELSFHYKIFNLQ